MCNPISWIEADGNVYVVTDAEIKSELGREMLREVGAEDIWGHDFCRRYYKIMGGREHEQNDFGKPGLFPPEIKKLLENFNGNFGEMMKLCFPSLSGLTSLPENVTFPEKCGSLYLSSLTSLPENVTFPEKCGYLDLKKELKETLKRRQRTND